MSEQRLMVQTSNSFEEAQPRSDWNDVIGTVFPNPFVVEVLDELQEWELPWFLIVVCQLSEVLRVHAEFASHLDMCVRKVEALSRIDPDFKVTGYPWHTLPPLFA